MLAHHPHPRRTGVAAEVGQLDAARAQTPVEPLELGHCARRADGDDHEARSDGSTATPRSVPGQTGVAVGPRSGLFELGRHPQQHVLPAVGGDQLHADGEAVGVQCSGREMAGCPLVLNTGVNGTQLADAGERGEGLLRVLGHGAERLRQHGGGGRQQQVPPPSAHHCCTRRRDLPTAARASA